MFGSSVGLRPRCLVHLWACSRFLFKAYPFPRPVNRGIVALPKFFTEGLCHAYRTI